jgi:hypothetical protein
MPENSAALEQRALRSNGDKSWCALHAGATQHHVKTIEQEPRVTEKATLSLRRIESLVDAFGETLQHWPHEPAPEPIASFVPPTANNVPLKL